MRMSRTALAHITQLDVALDGADEISPSLNCIKGGGGCHVQEKVVAAAAPVFILVADERKMSPQLGLPCGSGAARVTSGRHDVDEGHPTRRRPHCTAAGHRDPQGPWRHAGHPHVDSQGRAYSQRCAACIGPLFADQATDNGNFIVDVSFGPISDERAAELAVVRLLVCLFVAVLMDTPDAQDGHGHRGPRVVSQHGKQGISWAGQWDCGDPRKDQCLIAMTRLPRDTADVFAWRSASCGIWGTA